MPELQFSQKEKFVDFSKDPWPEDREQLFLNVEENAVYNHQSNIYWCQEFRPTLATADKKTFYREYVWCVLVSGFNARVVQGFWGLVGHVLCGFDPALVVKYEPLVLEGGRAVMRSVRKWKAITKTAQLLNEISDEDFRSLVLGSPDSLEQLPFIGGITKYHLARNIGSDVVKPDLHLVRIAEYYQYTTPHDFCIAAQEFYRDRLHVPYRLGTVDLAFWLYSLDYGTLQLI